MRSDYYISKLNTARCCGNVQVQRASLSQIAAGSVASALSEVARYNVMLGGNNSCMDSTQVNLCRCHLADHIITSQLVAARGAYVTLIHGGIVSHQLWRLCFAEVTGWLDLGAVSARRSGTSTRRGPFPRPGHSSWYVRVDQAEPESSRNVTIIDS